MNINRIISAVAAILAVSCQNGSRQDRSEGYSMPEHIPVIEGIGRVIPAGGILSLSSESEGRLTAVHITEGEKVTRGQPLMTIDPSGAELSLLMAENKVRTQLARIREAETAITRAEIEYRSAEEKRKTAENLQAGGAETIQHVRDAAKECSLKQASLEECRCRLSTAKAVLAEYENEVSAAKDDLDRHTVKAPSDGMVLEILVCGDANVRPHTDLMRFAADGPLVIEAEIDEIFADSIRNGQTADICSIGYGEKIGSGKICRTSGYLTAKSIFSGSTDERQDRQMRKITIMLDKPEKTPLLGSKVTCRINIKPGDSE